MKQHVKARCVKSPGKEIKRKVTREFEKILHPRHPTTEAETVHEVRKCFKKTRAALRLVHDELGSKFYRRENFYFRDAAQRLAEVRDAEVLVETIEKIGLEYMGQIDPEALAKVCNSLSTRQQKISQHFIKKNPDSLEVRKAITRAIDRISKWKLELNDWKALSCGLKHVYKKGGRALAVAAESPTPENLHEWRKQSKYLWYLFELLEPFWATREKNLRKQAHQLSQILGEDHDLAILRQTLTADPSIYGGQRILKSLLAKIDQKRKDLEKQAFTIGRHIYGCVWPKLFLFYHSPLFCRTHQITINSCSNK